MNFQLVHFWGARVAYGLSFLSYPEIFINCGCTFLSASMYLNILSNDGMFKDPFLLNGHWIHLSKGSSLIDILLCVDSARMSHRSTLAVQLPRSVIHCSDGNKTSVTNTFTDFCQSLVKCCVPCGCLINSWVVTDYSNWIHLKLIIFILIIFPSVWQQSKLVVICLGCNIQAQCPLEIPNVC